MYVNPLYKNENLEDALEIIKKFPLAIITDEHLQTSYMPSLASIVQNKKIKVEFHVPNIDPITSSLKTGKNVQVNFLGTNLYTSPTLYIDAGLPTFMYECVNVTGTPQMMDTQELNKHLETLIRQEENKFKKLMDSANSYFPGESSYQPWTAGDQAKERWKKLAKNISGFYVITENIKIKSKFGQNRSGSDVQNTIRLLEQAAEKFQESTALMKKARLGDEL